MSDPHFKNYSYQLCPTDEMDNIQKRSGWCKIIASCFLFLMSVGYVLLDSKTIEGQLENSAIVNNSVDANRTKDENRSDMIYYFTLLSLWMSVIGLASILHRICLLLEEWRHLKSRYGKSYQKLLSTVFSGGWTLHLVGFIAFPLCIYMDSPQVMSIVKSNKNFLIVTTTLLNVYLNYKEWTDTEFQHSKSHIPSTGTFMAYAAYYSYYKNVLPKLKERIIDAEEKYNIRIPFKKLIVLFPSSGRIPDSLEHGTDEIQRIDHLSSIKTNKEGTLDRKMKNPIYKIAPKGKEPYYCIVEGQNSLPVLKSMKQSKEIFKQQSYLLYKTLKEILEDSGEKGTYHLLCYNDEDEDDPQTLSQLLWNELDRQLNRQDE